MRLDSTHWMADTRAQETPRHVVSRLIDEAVTYAETELAPHRKKATAYYLRQKFGNEQEGRSQVVMSDVSDAVDAIVPGLMKVFFGPERVVEYAPTSPETVEMAAAATDYVQHVFTEENPGFLEALSVVKDGLIRRLGVFKYGWETPAPLLQVLDDVPHSQLVELVAEYGEAAVRGATRVGIAPAPDGGGEPTYRVRLLVPRDGRPRVWAIPPEDFLVDRDARTLDDATLVAHRTEKTTSELLALGVSQADIDEHGGTASTDNEEREARVAALGRSTSVGDRTRGDASTDKHTYVEAYVLLDAGDGRAALHLVRAIGEGYHVVGEPEPVRERPFALWCPKPEPHTIDGQSLADVTMDLQLLSSSLFRGMLDSLALSIFPRTAYVEGQVSVADILNTEIGAPIRTYAPGMVQPISHDFTGREVLPVLGYLDERQERRTGQSKGAQGLDADALQSSTRTAVAATVSATQQQLELYARIFAEQCLKPLFRGLLRLVVAHQPKAQMLKLRGKWVEIDPRAWDADMGVTVNVALGVGFTEEKVQALLAVAAKQEQILATLGPDNPLVKLGQYRHTLARILELQGFRDVQNFVAEVPADWQPPAPPAPPADPAAQLAQAQLQVEQMRTQRELAIKEAELQLKQAADQRAHDLELQKLASEQEIKRLELELKYRTQIEAARIAADVQRLKQGMDGELGAAKLEQQAAAAEHTAAMNERRQAHTEDVAYRQQDHAEYVAERDAARADQAAAADESKAAREAPNA